MQREGREQWQVLHAKIEHLLQQRQAMIHNIEEEVPRAEAAYHEAVTLRPAIPSHINDGCASSCCQKEREEMFKDLRQAIERMHSTYASAGAIVDGMNRDATQALSKIESGRQA